MILLHPIASDMLPEIFYDFLKTSTICVIPGAEERNRTSDLLITNQLLYQLSYNSTNSITQNYSLAGEASQVLYCTAPECSVPLTGFDAASCSVIARMCQRASPSFGYLRGSFLVQSLLCNDHRIFFDTSLAQGHLPKFFG